MRHTQTQALGWVLPRFGRGGAQIAVCSCKVCSVSEAGLASHSITRSSGHMYAVCKAKPNERRERELMRQLRCQTPQHSDTVRAKKKSHSELGYAVALCSLRKADRGRIPKVYR